MTLAGSAVLLVSLAGPAVAAPRAADGMGAKTRVDNHPGPLTARQDARRKEAQRLILSGQASPNEDGVVALGTDKYYQAAVQDAGRFFAILAEFGDQGSGKLGTVPGPLHNEIVEPNRPTVDGQANTSYDATKPLDNSTHWVGDAATGQAGFDRDVYLDLLFGATGSFKDFYEHMSSGNFTIDGDVAGAVNPDNDGWVKVPGNASTYGDNSVEDFGGAWQFIEDAGNTWYTDAVADMGSEAAVNAYLATFDVWDRYDWDNDGNFDEPDGYIDHFSAIHAGEGEDAGGGPQGADAIWSHRWYVNATDFGNTGPTGFGQFGGTQIGSSGIWIGDYTVEAENGGLGVHAHEFGHDLGLPDFYDTNAGENGTAFWTLMSSGSWLSEGTEDIGTRPNYYGPWEKLQLGWLNYTVAAPGDSSVSLDPMEAVIVDVADRPVATTYATPAGGHAWWTGNESDLNSTLTRSIDLTGLRSATLTTSAWYDIEAGYDYLYVEYSTDNGDTWTESGTPLDGSSSDRWKTLRYTIPGGATTLVRFRYASDGGVNMGGALLDNITFKSGGTTLFSDNVETGANGWTADGGFKISTGTEEVTGDRYYIAENRTYVDYDAGLEVGPYQFSFALTDPNKVEHFAFQDGLLVWMVDESYTDNNNSEHTGRGLSLPVDARPAPFFYEDGTKPSNRRQPFDATFGLQDVPAGPTADPEGGTLPCAGLHKQYTVGHGPSATVAYYCAWPSAGQRAAIATFNDSGENAYWDSTNAQNSVKTAGSLVQLTVTGQVTNGAIDVDINDAPTLP
jgi:immune inhibitor A